MSDDRGQIVDLLNLYGLAVDTRRWDLFDRIFTTDVDADYSNGRHWSDLASFKAGFDSAHAPLHHTQHAMANHLVAVRGDTAAAFTYAAWRLARRTDDGDDVYQGTACYDDSLRRVDGCWLITRRICRVTWREHRQVPAALVARMESELRTLQIKDLPTGGDGLGIFGLLLSQ
jgi:SnoaL-like domain